MPLDFGRVAARVLLTYVILLTLLRLAGKRAVDRASPFDFMFSILVGDLLDDILWMEVTLIRGFVAAGSLVLVHGATQLLVYMSPTLHRLLNGVPVELVHAGQPIRAGQTKERITDGELDEMLRVYAGVGRDGADEIERGQLEPHGRLTVRRYPRAKRAQKCDRVALQSEA
jgi:uncharacterized membrane protein YcaP (DUF421 family)